MTPGQQKTFQLTVPAGWTAAAFEAIWLEDETAPQFRFALRRPNNQVVSGTDSDVLDEMDVTSDGFMYVLSKGFHMNAPASGSVAGDSDW